jgi:hypothetical protein
VLFILTITNEAMPLFKENALYIVSIVCDILTFILCIIYIFLCYPYLNSRAILKVVPEEEQ